MTNSLSKIVANSEFFDVYISIKLDQKFRIINTEIFTSASNTMQYSDDGLTLDYNLLRDCYPAGRGWAKFMKSRPRKMYTDYVYYADTRILEKLSTHPLSLI